MGPPRHGVLLDFAPDANEVAGFPGPDEIESIALDLLDRLARSERLAGAWELSLVITDDEGIRAINREWRAKDASTDVLSFPQFEFWNGRLAEDAERLPLSDEPLLLGDIMISFETLTRQAGEIGHSVRDELLRLLVHGLLHLVGYDHERGAEEEALMQGREDELLAGTA